MIPLKWLFLVAGFEGGDIQRQISDLQRRFEAGSVRFLARPYPLKPEKRAGYLKAMVKSANELVFGPGIAANFCRRLDQPCVIQTGVTKRTAKTCDRSKSPQTACARVRPQLIIVLCADHIFDEVFDRLGRGALILRLAGPQLPTNDALKKAIDEFEPIAVEVIRTIAHRKKSLYAPLVPDRNFQRLGAHRIAADIQSDPANMQSIFAKYHRQLYQANFMNPVKPKIRGAYMLDPNTAFQEDHLHRTKQILGAESREDGFHLLNAYHVYGVKADPGFHFDVMNASGGAIRHVLTDILNGKLRGGAETHLNATPCDRLL
jgi:hypothetical protein